MARLTAPNGATVSVSDEKAERLLGQGYTSADPKPTAAPSGDVAPSAENGYDGNVGQLAELAEKRGLAVEGTGKGGKVVKSDLVAALKASDTDSDAGGDADSEDD